MAQKIANLTILVLLVGGVSWTIFASLYLGRPEWATCSIMLPQMKRRTIIPAAIGVVSIFLLRASAPELSLWKCVLYTLALWAEGHLLWPELD